MENQDYIKKKELAFKLNALVKELNAKVYEDNDTVNYYTLSTAVIKPDQTDKIDKFNKLYKEVKKEFTQLARTRSGGISIAAKTLIHNPFQYDIRTNSLNVTLTYVTDVGCAKIVVGYKIKNNKKALTGKSCGDVLLDEFKKANIDVSKYEVNKEEGKKLAEAIHKPENNIYCCTDETYKNVHHIDFHKFYPGGIALAYPEFNEVFQRLANKSKAQDIYKQYLDAGTRYFASKYSGYKYAKLIRDGIDTAYKRFFEVLNDLRKTRKILLTNTDGIWYQGEIYHGKYEGDKICEWSNDYENCTFRIKSVGAYEFICNGKYYPKVKGVSTYEKVVDREQWKWGDIYKGSVIKCYWDEDEGFIIEDDDEEDGNIF